MENEKKKKGGSKIALYVLYGVLTVLVLITILSVNDIDEIFKVMEKADLRYIGYALILLAVYLFTYPITTGLLTRKMGHKVSFFRCYSIGMIEHFFNGITPFASGGQPFQVYAFKKSKVNAGDSTGILLMNFIIFMIVTNGFALSSLVFANKFITDVPMAIFAVIGFTINFFVLFVLISLGVSKRVRRFLERLIDYFSKTKLIGRFLAPKADSLKEYFQNVQDAFKALWKSKGTFFACLGIKFISMSAYYAITFFIMRALGIFVGIDQLFFVMAGSSFAITMVVFLPTPGSSGGIEFAFNAIFASIAGIGITAVSYSGMLIWRLLTYYLVMAISLIFYIMLEVFFFRRNKDTDEEKDEKTEEKVQ
ncbi:MAG: flippase-like domain-containing protein [Clostridia bacterium]|nr:flippase-like domain-containing protein [Clostridia bacterium]